MGIQTTAAGTANADQSTSPGKGHIPYSGGNCGSVSMTADQRGYARGNGGACDSGAYEYAGSISAARHRPLPKAAPRHAGKTLMPFPRLERYVTRMMPIIPRSS